jgi:hypothetical protein
MSPRLVFVHGIGGVRRPDEECARWAGALAEGFRRSGHTDLARRCSGGFAGGREIDLRFCYYGDLFGRPHAQGAGGADVDQRSSELLVALLIEMVEGHLAETVDDDVRGSLLAAREQLCPPGAAQGVGDLVRRAVNVATTLLGVGPLRRAGQWVSGRLMVADLAQVARYLARGEVDEHGVTLDGRIRARVCAAFGDGPVIVVTHSLGTVVGVEALHECPAAVPLLVTLGSPLALRTVVLPRLAPQPPRVPETVDGWLNAWDRDDIIVGRPDLAADFAPSSRGVRPESVRTDADGVWVHTATKYLGNAAVAGPIAAVINRNERG